MLNILTLNKPNITDFSLERNELLKKAKTNWVLFLDQDERLSNSIKSIKPVKSINCYTLERKNYFLRQYVGTDKIIRLVKKGTGKWKRAVHEVWVPNKSHLVGTILNNYIIHNTASNLTDYINKINNYSDLHAKANLDETKKSNLFKIIFYPIGKFVLTLVKSKHIVFSIMQSLHSYLSWTKMYFRPDQNKF